MNEAGLTTLLKAEDQFDFWPRTTGQTTHSARPRSPFGRWFPVHNALPVRHRQTVGYRQNHRFDFASKRGNAPAGTDDTSIRNPSA